MEFSSVVPAGRGGSETLPLMSSSNLGSSNVVPLLLGTAEAPTHTLLEVMVDVGMESVKLRSVSTAAGTASAARQENNNNNIQDAAAAAISWVDATTAGICSSSSSSFRRIVDQAGDAGRGGDIQQARCSSSRSGAGEYSFRESFRRLTSATSFVRQLSQELPFLPRNSSRVQASNSPDLFDPELAKASLSSSTDEYSSTSTSSPPEQQQHAAAAAATATGGGGMVRTMSGAEYALEGLRFISQATATADQKYLWEAVETRFKRLASCDNTLARSNFAECIGKKKIKHTKFLKSPSSPPSFLWYSDCNLLPSFLDARLLLLLLLLLRITRMSIVTTQFSSHNKTAFFELQLLCHEELQCFFCCINTHELQLAS